MEFHGIRSLWPFGFSTKFRPGLKFLTTKLICENNQIPFIDVNNEEIRNNIDFYYNSNHLNTKGIAEMNRLLRNDPQLNALLKN